MNSAPPTHCPRCGNDLTDEHGNNNGLCRFCIWPVKPWTAHHFKLRMWWPLMRRKKRVRVFLYRCGWKYRKREDSL
jgi:hypothetical protein